MAADGHETDYDDNGHAVRGICMCGYVGEWYFQAWSERFDQADADLDAHLAAAAA